MALVAAAALVLGVAGSPDVDGVLDHFGAGGVRVVGVATCSTRGDNIASIIIEMSASFALRVAECDSNPSTALPRPFYDRRIIEFVLLVVKLRCTTESTSWLRRRLQTRSSLNSREGCLFPNVPRSTQTSVNFSLQNTSLSTEDYENLPYLNEQSKTGTAATSF